MGMLSDFLTLIKGTQTNINGVLVGKNGKIDSSSVDSVPTADSTNLITSGAVKSAIDSVNTYSKSLFDNSNDSAVFKVGSVCNIFCLRGSWYADANGLIHYNAADGDTWTIPEGFRPVSTVRITDANVDKKLYILANGEIHSVEAISGANLRFSVTYLSDSRF